MVLAFGVDVSQVGLDEMREYPELGGHLWQLLVVQMMISWPPLATVPACGGLYLFIVSSMVIDLFKIGWASVHVSMNILLFLIKLNFR